MLNYAGRVIAIDLRSIMQKDYIVSNLPILEDQLIQCYNGQDLCFYALDGNDVLDHRLVGWIQNIQKGLNIADNKISFVSVSPSLPQWQWVEYPLVAFNQIGSIIEPYNIDRDLTNAKFVGILAASRWSVTRLRIAYQTDHAFPNDAFVTYTENYKHTLNQLHSYYQKEIDWADNRQFDNDMLPIKQAFDFKDAAVAYCKIWNRFWIEIVCETDEYQNQWFTDKTAKCLATGKPFLLLSGQHSLKNLKKLGFVSFDDFIDESYDQCVLPGQRVQAIIKSLQSLYSNSNRSHILFQMQNRAKENIDIYRKYVQSKI